MPDKIEKIKEDIKKYIQTKEIIDEEWIEDKYPIDIADAISEMKEDKVKEITDMLDTEDLAEILEQSEEYMQINILKTKTYDEIIDIFSYMPKDVIADIMGNLPIYMGKELLTHMKQSEAKVLKELLGYDIESAGGLMTTEYILFKKELTVAEALNKIKEIEPKTEVLDMIYVENKKKELVGVVELRDIFNSPNDTKLEEIMIDNIISVEPEEDQEIVAQLVAKYDLSVIPVVNKNKRLLGIITFDDIIDVIEAENTEDMFRMVGVNEEESINSPFFKSVKRRLPWLFINLGTAFLAAITVGLFEDVISQVAVLAAAMPVVAGMGGNAGTQTLSVVIRGIALGEVEDENKWKLVFKEGALGLIHGIAIGILTGIILYFMYGNFYLGIIIFASMVFNLVLAGLFGFLIPLGLQAMGIDPALASAIFLTTATDVFGFFAFLGLARIFLDLLV
ncbi:MAG: magnesium transporter [Halanaerobiales bacterium]|nr:magnesium transporter [Halanaerobiales bacterium]